MTVWRHGQAMAEHPGKHGEGDYRATFCKRAPTLAEFVFLLGTKLLAEDRYDRHWMQGRHLYLGLLKEAAQARSMDEVCAIAKRADGIVRNNSVSPTGFGFTPCCEGGENACVSLCKPCFDAGFRLPDEVVVSTLQWWGIANEAEIPGFVHQVKRGRR